MLCKFQLLYLYDQLILVTVSQVQFVRQHYADSRRRLSACLAELLPAAGMLAGTVVGMPAAVMAGMLAWMQAGVMAGAMARMLARVMAGAMAGKPSGMRGGAGGSGDATLPAQPPQCLLSSPRCCNWKNHHHARSSKGLVFAGFQPCSCGPVPSKSTSARRCFPL